MGCHGLASLPPCLSLPDSSSTGTATSFRFEAEIRGCWSESEFDFGKSCKPIGSGCMATGSGFGNFDSQVGSGAGQFLSSEDQPIGYMFCYLG